jgi:hypothetical protein
MFNLQQSSISWAKEGSQLIMRVQKIYTYRILLKVKQTPKKH